MRQSRRIGATLTALAASALVAGAGGCGEDEAPEGLVADLGGIEIDSVPDAPASPAAPPAPPAPAAEAAPAPPRPRSAPRTPESAAAKEKLGKDIATLAPQVQRCYERVLKGGDDVGGTVAVAFTIEPAGHVRGVRISRDGIRRADLRDCILKVVGDWRFPPTGDGPVDVEYPFHLRPGF
ncbi:AgmX/PglI C-terminal domain-containing protein [Myxococcota bacterium]|nr:AgmX/PglI C-terminal domain-containing protein [Myxococcota bacterium]